MRFKRKWDKLQKCWKFLGIELTIWQKLAIYVRFYNHNFKTIDRFIELVGEDVN